MLEKNGPVTSIIMTQVYDGWKLTLLETSLTKTDVVHQDQFLF